MDATGPQSVGSVGATQLHTLPALPPHEERPRHGHAQQPDEGTQLGGGGHASGLPVRIIIRGALTPVNRIARHHFSGADPPSSAPAMGLPTSCAAATTVYAQPIFTLYRTHLHQRAACREWEDAHAPEFAEIPAQRDEQRGDERDVCGTVSTTRERGTGWTYMRRRQSRTAPRRARRPPGSSPRRPQR